MYTTFYIGTCVITLFARNSITQVGQEFVKKNEQVVRPLAGLSPIFQKEVK